ncbi:hypothetical protein [Pontibacter chitinilyticus]|uniref:hypothetical protein n=1 Tax=Pontibacter chitinilyticus TaxID=2674989 RepID=UPI00321A033B
MKNTFSTSTFVAAALSASLGLYTETLTSAATPLTISHLLAFGLPEHTPDQRYQIQLLPVAQCKAAAKVSGKSRQQEVTAPTDKSSNMRRLIQKYALPWYNTELAEKLYSIVLPLPARRSMRDAAGREVVHLARTACRSQVISAILE